MCLAPYRHLYRVGITPNLNPTSFQHFSRPNNYNIILVYKKAAVTARIMAKGEALDDMASPVNGEEDGEVEDSVGEGVEPAAFALLSPGAAAAGDAALGTAASAAWEAAASALAAFDAWTAAASVAEAMAATPA